MLLLLNEFIFKLAAYLKPEVAMFLIFNGHKWKLATPLQPAELRRLSR